MMCFEAARARTVKSARDFGADERGSLIIFTLFILLAMLVVSGLAVDFMRTETTRTRLQATLDRSVLAAASMSQNQNSRDVVIDYFERADLDQYLDKDSISIVETEYNKTVAANAYAPVTPFFMQLLGYSELPAPAAGTAREGFSNLEISLILDVSGSMAWTSPSSGRKKLEDLKDAAQEFVYRIQCNPETDNLFADPCTVEPDTVSINLVVYQEQVLVGEDLLSRFNVTNEHTNSSCVDFKNEDYFTTAIGTDQLLKRAGHIDSYTWWWKGFAGYENSHRAKENLRTCLNPPQLEILPLEEDWQTLYNRIEALTARGGTSIEMGLKWGTALLDPAFRPVATDLIDDNKVISEFYGRPVDYSDANMDKFVVLMTDGENTWHFELKDEYRSGLSDVWYDDDVDNNPSTKDEYISIYRAAQNQYINPWTGAWTNVPGGTGPVQLTWTQVWQKFGTDFYDNGRNNANAQTWTPNPVNTVNVANKNSNMVQICAAAAANQVQIFTVGFETTPAATSHLKKCASSESHHFEANGTNLDVAFAAIARSIQKLRLVN